MNLSTTVNKAIVDATLMLQDHAQQRGVVATAKANWATIAALVPESIPLEEHDLYRATFRQTAEAASALLRWALEQPR